MSNKVSKNLTAELEQLRAEKKALEEQNALLIAKNKSNKSKRLKFRIESTKTANSFHIAVNEIFLDAETIKTDFSSLFVSYDETNNEYVFKSELRDELKKILQKAVN